MTEKKSVKITAAKGRPMLTWVGKRPLAHVTAFPAQHIETFAVEGGGAQGDWTDWPAAHPRGGLLFHGDNKEVLAHHSLPLPPLISHGKPRRRLRQAPRVE